MFIERERERERRERGGERERGVEGSRRTYIETRIDTLKDFKFCSKLVKNIMLL